MRTLRQLYKDIRDDGIVIVFGKKQFKYNVKEAAPRQIQTTVRQDNNPFGMLGDYRVGIRNYGLYKSLREIPIFERAIELTKDLVGDWNPETTNPREEKAILDFKENVLAGYKQKGYIQFRRQFLDTLLLYGTAFGEIVPNILNESIESLFVLSPKTFGFKLVDNDYLFAYQDGPTMRIVPNQDLIVYQTQKQELNDLFGESMFRSLPFVGQILTRALNAFETRYWREGNPTYFFSIETDKDSPLTDTDVNTMSSLLQTSVKDVMQLKRMGQAGDVFAPMWGGAKLIIKAIGVDKQSFNDEIPMKTVFEQISAGTGYPLFLLNVHSESSAYKLTTHQAENVTAQINQKRFLLEYIDKYIINMHLTMLRIQPTYKIKWNDVNLTDETEKARAELFRAQAKKAIAETVIQMASSGLIEDTNAITDFIIENNLMKLEKSFNKERLMSEVKNFLLLKDEKKLDEYFKS